MYEWCEGFAEGRENFPYLITMYGQHIEYFPYRRPDVGKQVK